MRVLQLVPAMHVGGVERGVLEIDSALTEASASSLVASSGGPLVSQLKGAHLQCGLLARRDPFCVLLFNPLRLAFWLRRHLTPRARLIATWHGFYTSGNPIRRFFNGLLLCSSRLILPSRFIWTHLCDEYPNADTTNWRLVHRGVGSIAPRPAVATQARSAEQVAPARPAPGRGEAVVLLPGRISLSKGQHLLIDALERLPRTIATADGETASLVFRLLGQKQAFATSKLPCDHKTSRVALGFMQQCRRFLGCSLAHAGRVRPHYEELVTERLVSARRAGVAVSLEPCTSCMQ
ncbi:MAG: hypothetical protein SGPRY_000174, partial [Prymnesium sp.]